MVVLVGCGGAPEPIPDRAQDQSDDGWIQVPGGFFVMGSPDREIGRDDDEGPPLKLEVQPFSLQRTPVTSDAFARRLEAVRDLEHEARWWTESETPEAWLGRCNVGSARGDHPANCVTWQAARAYCLSIDADLPTEAEWEIAARAGSSTPYWWGDEFVPERAVSSVECGERGCLGGTAPVVSSGPRCNAWGACDMAGNVWEWTVTAYRPELGDYANARATSGHVPDQPVHRGAAWLNHVSSLFRSAHRGLNYPEHGLTGVGFRCVRR
jgi:formylglycine-generating enzyme